MRKESVKTPRNNVAAPFLADGPVKLNLGSGFRPLDGYVNIDNRDICKPDLVYDLANGIPFPDDSVDEVRAFDFLEHLADIAGTLKEIHRVLKPGGILDFMVPSTDGRGAFQDPTHKSFWNKNTWLYFTNGDWHSLYPDYPLFAEVEIIRDEGHPYGVIQTLGKVGAVK